ncbi:MAG: alanine racemase, partial [Chloroflexota bacterium]|nr:alanine racemase [Chloroflexota bacterium]
AGMTCVAVRDTRAALRAWGGHVLRRQAPLVIGVTGSVGKTGTTKAIATLLRHLGDDPRAVFDNDNFNDLFGLPISLSRLAPTHQTAVLELASDSAGEIAALCRLVAPTWGVITNVAPAHLQHFETLERLAGEYGDLAEAVRERLILNADDPLVRRMAGRITTRCGVTPEVVTYGLGEAADVRATDVRSEPGAAGEPGGWPLAFRLHWRGAVADARLRLLGRHNMATALAAASTALCLGRGLPEVAAALATLEPLPGRLCPLSGRGGTTLLDDTFSASVPSTLAALDVMAECARPRVFVLGDVSGAGGAGGGGYRQIGTAAPGAVDYLLAVGDGAAEAVRAAREAGLAPSCLAVTHTVEDTVATVTRWIGSAGGTAGAEQHDGTGGVTLDNRPHVLVKGSEGTRLERVVERLLERPEAHTGALVRQAPGAKQVVPLHQDRATWMEVDLGAIAGNLARLREIVAPAAVLAVLKADAYGHGAVRVARTAVQHGAAMLGTAVLSEAATLRSGGITAPILVMGYTPAWQARDVVRLDVAVCLSSLDASLDLAHSLSRAALALQRPAAAVHLKVDTGMHRLGLRPEDVVPFARQVAALSGVRIEGLFTHCATADAADLGYAREQLQRFQDVLASWMAAGLPRPRYVHAANSAAALRLPEARFDLVRPGIALYGLQPSEAAPLPEGFRPALALKTQIAHVHDLPAGEPVSYGNTWVTPRPSRIGVLPLGYADGLRRAPATWGDVLIRGQRAPLVGRVCMDMCMVDVTDIAGARPGDEVVLIGEQGGGRITAEEVATRLGTINYEVVCQILARVPREIVSH